MAEIMQVRCVRSLFEAQFGGFVPKGTVGEAVSILPSNLIGCNFTGINRTGLAQSFYFELAPEDLTAS